MHSSARTAFFLGYRHTTYCTKIRKGMISLSVLSLKASQALLIILGQLQRQAFTRKRPEVVVPWMVEFATACSLLVLAESRLWSLWSLESLRTHCADWKSTLLPWRNEKCWETSPDWLGLHFAQQLDFIILNLTNSKLSKILKWLWKISFLDTHNRHQNGTKFIQSPNRSELYKTCCKRNFKHIRS